MPFVDVAGKTGAISPEQIDIVVVKLKTGIMIGFTFTTYTVGTAHWPASGVNV